MMKLLEIKTMSEMKNLFDPLKRKLRIKTKRSLNKIYSIEIIKTETQWIVKSKKRWRGGTSKICVILPNKEERQNGQKKFLKT